MKPENQVCTLQQAKHLKELGVCHNSYFCYNHPKESYWKGEDGELPIKLIKSLGLYGFYSEHEYYAAFTVAEIRQAIGIGFTVVQTGYVSGTKVGNLYSVIKDAHFPNKPGHYPDAPEVGWEYLHSIGWFGDDQPIQDGEAHGALLIWLLENNHVTIEDVNQRLQSA